MKSHVFGAGDSSFAEYTEEEKELRVVPPTGVPCSSGGKLENKTVFREAGCFFLAGWLLLIKLCCVLWPKENRCLQSYWFAVNRQE